jgi:hypothetical protein
MGDVWLDAALFAQPLVSGLTPSLAASIRDTTPSASTGSAAGGSAASASASGAAGAAPPALGTIKPIAATYNTRLTAGMSGYGGALDRSQHALSALCYDPTTHTVCAYSAVRRVMDVYQSGATNSDRNSQNSSQLAICHTKVAEEDQKSTSTSASAESSLGLAARILEALALYARASHHSQFAGLLQPPDSKSQSNRASSADAAESGSSEASAARSGGPLYCPFGVDVHPFTFTALSELLRFALTRLKQPDSASSSPAQQQALVSLTCSLLQLLEANLRPLTARHSQVRWPQLSASVLPALRASVLELASLSAASALSDAARHSIRQLCHR